MEFSNRDIERLFDQYNRNNIRSGDRVLVNMGDYKYRARVVGLNLDVKNRKVFADLRLRESHKRFPIRVDVNDCFIDKEGAYLD